MYNIINYYNDHCSEYKQKTNHIDMPEDMQTLLNFNTKENKYLLDIGCGTGRNLKLFEAGKDIKELYGLDISSKMIDEARITTERSRFLQINYIDNKIEPLLPKIDVVWCSGGLVHNTIREIISFLNNNLYEVLNDKAVIFISLNYGENDFIIKDGKRHYQINDTNQSLLEKHINNKYKILKIKKDTYQSQTISYFLEKK